MTRLASDKSRPAWSCGAKYSRGVAVGRMEDQVPRACRAFVAGCFPGDVKRKRRDLPR